MWMPHFLLEFWEHEASPDSAKIAQEDVSEREYEIWFMLEDIPARLLCDSGIQLDKRVEKLLTDLDDRKLKVCFEPNDKKRLGQIAFKISDTNAKKAFHYCYNLSSQLLSSWALINGTGFGIYGLRVIDKKHNIVYKVVPQRTRPEPFSLPNVFSVNNEYAAMLSLYREGRNTSSPFYRFLCFYKILEARYKLKDSFAVADRIIKEKGLPLERPKRRITEEMLIFSMIPPSLGSKFSGKTFGEFFDLLNPYRIQVAHAITDEGIFIDMDKYQSMVELGPITNLVDQVAREILLDEVKLWGSIQAANKGKSQN